MATTYAHIASNKRRSVVLVLVFIVIVVALGWVIDQFTGGDMSFLAIAAILSIVMSLIGYFAGDQIALRTARAQLITKEQSPYLYRLVENLAIGSGLPMPKVYVIPDPTINAFATGRDPQHASIAVTTGAIESLENEELEGVLAHELSHIGNYDIRFMTLVAILAGVIVLLSDMFWHARMFGGGRRDSRESGNAGGILMIVGLLLLVLAPIIAQLIQLAVSRRREFLADASGALLTRYPEGLARALEKIEQKNTHPMAGASNATAHLFISNPFGPARGLTKLFNTHPPVADRVTALLSMGGVTRR